MSIFLEHFLLRIRIMKDEHPALCRIYFSLNYKLFTRYSLETADWVLNISVRHLDDFAKMCLILYHLIRIFNFYVIFLLSSIYFFLYLAWCIWTATQTSNLPKYSKEHCFDWFQDIPCMWFQCNDILFSVKFGSGTLSPITQDLFEPITVTDISLIPLRPANWVSVTCQCGRLVSPGIWRLF